MRIKTLIVLCMVIFAFSLTRSYSAERTRIDDITKILQYFKNYRFGEVSIWEVKDAAELKEIVATKKKKISTGEAATSKECVNQIDQNIRIKYVRSGVLQEKSLSAITLDILNDGLTPDNELLKCVYQHYVDSLSGPVGDKVIHAYIVTTKPAKYGLLPDTIIAMIVIENDFAEDTPRLSVNLKNPNEDQIFSIYTLQDESKNSRGFIDPSKYGFSTIYDLLKSYFIQGNVEDRTLEARGISSDITYFPKTKGIAEAIIKTNEVSSEDVQAIKRISEGQPEKYFIKTNEVIVSPDLIRWTKYQQRYKTDRRGAVRTDSLGKLLIDDSRATNDYLPQFGVELRYGIEEIMYPSFWSERMTISALWESVRMGIILPTNGWSSLGKDMFGIERKLTFASAGISGAIDFPVELIPKTGIIHASFSYVFGDAQKPEYRRKYTNNELLTVPSDDRPFDWLVRYSGQMHYTFGVAVDKDFLFRFGIGFTIYGVESWQQLKSFEVDPLTQDTNTVQIYSNVVNGKIESNNKTIGGLSGKMEFMAQAMSTPFGIGLQYFDEALSINGWFQIPLVRNLLSMRLEVNGYVPAFRKEQHAWENKSVVIPTLRFIVVF